MTQGRRTSLPPKGTVLEGYRRKPVRLVVRGLIVADATATDGVALGVDGVRYPTLSAAARAITGSKRNGWRWWRTQDGRPVAKLREERV